MEWLREALLTWRGRLDRRRFAIMYIVAWLPGYLIAVLFSILRFGVSDLGGDSVIDVWDSITTLTVVIALATPLSSIAARRLHDVGVTAVWLLAPALVAFAAVSLFWARPEISSTWIGPAFNGCLLTFAAFLLFWPGQRGDNRFGASGRKI